MGQFVTRARDAARGAAFLVLPLMLAGGEGAQGRGAASMGQFATRARDAARGAAFLVLPLMLAGCEPLSLTVLGVGGSAAVNHKISSTPTRTFTMPLLK